ncbi:hypothetical protein HDU98_006204 [Podochytrium sp. JEL0797]|nr:hypothetical protein HDU98_006204 [Podochytrium sp. JEL0797]
MHSSTITKVIASSIAESQPAKDQKVILLAIDNTVFSDFCVRWFLDANIFADAFVYLVNVQPHFNPVDVFAIPSDSDEAEREESIKLLKKYSEMLKVYERQFSALLLVSHSPKETIVAKAMELNAQMVVMGSRGSDGLSRLVSGNSFSDYVQHHCQMPVLVVKPSAADVAKMVKPVSPRISMHHVF